MADPVGYFNFGGTTVTLAATVPWTRLDSAYALQSITVDRGRSYEWDKTATGTARVTFIDSSGDLDFTNASAKYSPSAATAIDVMKQAVICLPVNSGGTLSASTWAPIFRGFISGMELEPHPTERYFTVTYELVDALNILARTGLVPSTTSTPIFGSTVPVGTEGDVYYAGSTATDAVQTRINQVLDEVGWPSSMRQVFTGNVKLLSATYPYGTSALAVIQDAADGEFVGVSNFYVNAGGTVCFHGRYARFDPVTTAASNGGAWDFTDWYVGDVSAATASPSTVVPLSPPVKIVRDEENLYTAAIATPQGVYDATIASQYVTSSTAIAAYGLRTWSAENLLNAGGQINSNGAATFTGLQVTHAQANYVVQNYNVPRTRLGQLTIRPQSPAGTFGTATWSLLTGVDISDRVTVKTTHYGGGGFSGTSSGSTFFVEGVHYEIQPGGAVAPDVTLTLDVSPAGYYSTMPTS